MRLRVYLAAQFPKKILLGKLSEDLQSEGIHVTSRWLTEKAAPDSTLDQSSPEYLRKHAMIDINDIHDADVVVLFTEDPLVGIPRGGRHFEAGYAFAMQMVFGIDDMQLITVGPRENIFHYLDGVLNFPTWAEAKVWLKEENERRKVEASRELDTESATSTAR